MTTPRSIGPFGLFLAGLWGLAVCVGMGILVDYQTRPGEAATAPHRWPEASRIPRPSGRHQLLVFAHPRCPCTRASIRELALIMARCRDRLNAHVLFLLPSEFERDWAKSDLWRSAASIPGVTAQLDEGGAEARRFKAATSGHTVLYDGAGRLLFSGGITGSRGHSGDNVGRSSIVSQLNDGASRSTRRSQPDECSVYGCPLFNDDATQTLGR